MITDTPSGLETVILINEFLAIVFSAIVSGTLVFGSFQAIRGRKVDLPSCLSHGLRIAVLVILVSFAVGILIVIGMAALIIPGLFLLVILAVAVPIVVVEDVGVLSMKKAITMITVAGVLQFL